MKKLFCLTIILVILTGTNSLPFRGTDVGKLHPIEVLYVEWVEGQCEISTDTGITGRGRTVEEAAADLHRVTPGYVFLETANYLLLSSQTETAPEDFWPFVRPACLLYLCDEKPKLESVADYLKSHLSEVTLLDWRNGENMFPRLLQEGEIVRLYES